MDTMNKSTLGAKIEQERKNRRISLREFARQLGISAAYLVDIEKNRRLPSGEVLKKVADLLEIPISAFDEFSPEIPKSVMDWIRKNPLIERMLRVIKKTPFPEKALNNLERTLTLPYYSDLRI